MNDDLVVVVNVNDPPLCSAARPVPALLWPPNHKMVEVGITGLADPNNDQLQIAITGVSQDEPLNGREPIRASGRLARPHAATPVRPNLLSSLVVQRRERSPARVTRVSLSG